MTRSKTIHIHLKEANPNGIKIAEFSNSNAQVFVLPREQIEYANTRSELSSPSLYFLFDDERTSVYIGECESFNTRIKSHIKGKNFWEWAVVVVRSGNGLDKAEVKYLESYVINKAVEVGRYNVKNKTAPQLNNLHEFREETILGFFDDVELLLNTLGFNIFEPLSDSQAELEDLTQSKSETNDERQFDTIVCPATGDGFERAFKGKNAWWAIRIGKHNIPKLKYIAIYEASPISAIRFYAKITKIEPFEDSPGKYIIYHDGDIKELDPHVVLGDNPNLAPYGSRYYKIEDITSSSNLTELTEKSYKS